jgi:hypothetical protein
MEAKDYIARIEEKIKLREERDRIAEMGRVRYTLQEQISNLIHRYSPNQTRSKEDKNLR